MVLGQPDLAVADFGSLTPAEMVLVRMAYKRLSPLRICFECHAAGHVYVKRSSDHECQKIEEVCLACGIRKGYIRFDIGESADDFCLICGNGLFRQIDVGSGTVQVCAHRVNGECAAHSKQPLPVEAQRLAESRRGIGAGVA